MAKKTKKQAAIEKRIKTLKSDHKKLSSQKRGIQKKLNREEKARQKKLDRLGKAVDRAQKAWDKLDAQYLPSTNNSQKITSKLLILEEKIRVQEQALRVITEPHPSDAKREREAGEETEE